VSSIEPGGVDTKESFHPGDQIAPGGLDHPMEVIIRQTERMDLPTGFPASLPHGIQETPPISILPEDRLPAVPPIHDLVDRSRMLDPQLAWHPQQRPGHAIYCK
jgi:hypothetical protein